MPVQISLFWWGIGSRNNRSLNRRRRVAVATASTQNVNTVPYGKKNAPRTRTAPRDESGTGFLLLDSLLNPISFNTEAIQILGHPDAPLIPDSGLPGMIRATLLNQQIFGEASFVTEFWSGRRHYFCRTFRLDFDAQGMSVPSIAVLLERGPSGFVSLSTVSRRFNLTRREREVLEYLLQGLDTKTIADRMGISPNTVKVFLRLAMLKLGVSSRSAAVVKIIMSSR